MKRTKAQALQTKEQLVLAALEVFHRHGVARTSLNEIAQAAGMTRGALYWHFRNKEALFEALFQHFFDEMAQKLDEDIRHATPNMLHNLRLALINNFERIQHNARHRKFCHILHLMCEHTAQNKNIITLMHRYQQMWQQLIHNALKLCIRQGALPQNLDIDLATAYFQSTIFGLMHQWLFAPEQFSLDVAAVRITDAALHTLENSVALRLPDEGLEN